MEKSSNSNFPITVVNKHSLLNNNTDLHIFIGRGSPLGNPFTHLKLEDTKAEFQVNTREEAIDAYKKYIVEQIKSGNKEILKALKQIKTVMKVSPVSLICYCKPKACHGDVIKFILENQNKPK